MGRTKKEQLEDDGKPLPIPELPEGIKCDDCDEDVDLVITRDQFVGINRVICTGCKEKRIMERAAEKKEKYHRAVVEARQAKNQLSMAV